MDIETLNQQVKLILDLRTEEARISNEKKAITEKLDEAESKMREILEQAGMTSYKSPFGTTSISYRTSVKTPKTAEDRAKFFEHLKKLGLYDNMVTVNSQTLNSFYKSELEQAKERGDSDFEIPGLTEVTLSPILMFRRS